MGFSSLHVCMESSPDNWLQGTIHEEPGMDSSSPSGDMIACSRPMIERKLRPPQDQALKCPRCDSTHTKFCYYNNYSLSQPRYFCKACRRYWTKGGTLRNIPVGGGCRKNKKVSSKKQNDQPAAVNNQNQAHASGPSTYHHNNPKELQISNFPDVQFSHINNFFGTNGMGLMGNPNFMEGKYGMGMLENPRPLDHFMDSSKLEGMIRSSRNYEFFGNSSDHVGVGVGVGDINGYNVMPSNYQGLCSSAFGGMSLDGNNSGSYIMGSSQRLMLPYDSGDNQNTLIDVKPNPRQLSLEWQDHGCNDGKEPFGYLNGPGSWTGVMNGYGSSTTNPLV